MTKTSEEDLRVATELVRDCNVVFGNPKDAVDRIASMRAAEREKAAKIAETSYQPFQTGYNAGKWIAAAIRAGDKE